MLSTSLLRFLRLALLTITVSMIAVFLNLRVDPLCRVSSEEPTKSADTEKMATTNLRPGESDSRLLDPYREKAKKWVADIDALLELDKTKVANASDLLFLGSSSIRLWNTIEEDMAPWPVVRRGYGGAKSCDLAIYTPRLVAAHHPKAVIVFVANDIAGSTDDKDSATIVQIYADIVKSIRQQMDQSRSQNDASMPIFIIGITPTPLRWHLWQKISAANLELEAWCKSQNNVFFIATAAYYLDRQGVPRNELFTKDRLHQNLAGYTQWSSIIKDALEERGLKSDPSEK